MKRGLGLILAGISLIGILFSPQFTGFSISTIPSEFLGIKLIFIAFFFWGLFLFASSGLEKAVKSEINLPEEAVADYSRYVTNSNDSNSSRYNSSESINKPKSNHSLRNRIIAALAIAGIGAGVGGFYGNKLGKAVQPYAQGVERTGQISTIVGESFIPGSDKVVTKAMESYLKQIGEQGTKYLNNSKTRSSESYLKDLGKGISIIQDSLGKNMNELTSKNNLLDSVQETHGNIFVGTGNAALNLWQTITGQNTQKTQDALNAKNSEKYLENYNKATSQRVDALIGLNQIDKQIRNYSSKLISAGRNKLNSNERAKLEKLAKEANQLHSYLDNRDDLTWEDVANTSTKYQQVVIDNEEVPDAGYPVSEKIPGYGAMGGGVAGAYVADKLRRKTMKAAKAIKNLTNKRKEKKGSKKK